MSVTLTRVPGATVTPAQPGQRCSWCDQSAQYSLVEYTAGRNWEEVTCTVHLLKYWPEATIIAPARKHTDHCLVCAGQSGVGCEVGRRIKVDTPDWF